MTDGPDSTCRLHTDPKPCDCGAKWLHRESDGSWFIQHRDTCSQPIRSLSVPGIPGVEITPVDPWGPAS